MQPSLGWSGPLSETAILETFLVGDTFIFLTRLRREGVEWPTLLP